MFSLSWGIFFPDTHMNQKKALFLRPTHVDFHPIIVPPSAASSNHHRTFLAQLRCFTVSVRKIFTNKVPACLIFVLRIFSLCEHMPSKKSCLWAWPYCSNQYISACSLSLRRIESTSHQNEEELN